MEIFLSFSFSLSHFLRDQQQAGATVMGATKDTSFSLAQSSVPFSYLSAISHHIDPHVAAVLAIMILNKLK